MSDEMDMAQDRAQIELDRAIALARRPALDAARIYGGLCMNDCGEMAQPVSRFCSHECLDDAEARYARAKISGAR